MHVLKLLEVVFPLINCDKKDKLQKLYSSVITYCKLLGHLIQKVPVKSKLTALTIVGWALSGRVYVHNSQQLADR